MEGGSSKVIPPNSHPSNSIHNAAAPVTKKVPNGVPQIPIPQAQPQANVPTKKPEEPTPLAGSGNKDHDVNKIIVAVGGVVIARVLFFSLSEWRRR